jgi:alpha-ketoglutarate-dependent taurine dioxygenase
MNKNFPLEPGLPLIITPQGDTRLATLINYIQRNQNDLQSSLLTHGALLLRGFDVNNNIDFRAVTAGFGALPFSYAGGNSPRTLINDDVYTSTEYPASETISLHNEMSYLRTWPRRLFFYSEVPAAQGGQTSLACSRRVLKEMPTEIVDALKNKRLKYVKYFKNGINVGKGWQNTYLTDDRAAVEKLLIEQGSSFTWSNDYSLQVATDCDATAIHPVQHCEVWFNQAEQWHPSALSPPVRTYLESKGLLVHHCMHEDGSPLDENMLAEIRRVANKNKVIFDWQRSDVLIIDNLLTMHGREPYKGKRTTLAFLSST